MSLCIKQELSHNRVAHPVEQPVLWILSEPKTLTSPKPSSIDIGRIEGRRERAFPLQWMDTLESLDYFNNMKRLISRRCRRSIAKWVKLVSLCSLAIGVKIRPARCTDHGCLKERLVMGFVCSPIVKPRQPSTSMAPNIMMNFIMTLLTFAKRCHSFFLFLRSHWVLLTWWMVVKFKENKRAHKTYGRFFLPHDRTF